MSLLGIGATAWNRPSLRGQSPGIVPDPFAAPSNLAAITSGSPIGMLLVGATARSSHSCEEKPFKAPPYVLTQKPYGNEQIDVRIIQTATGKTLWRTTTCFVETYAWSADHRMLALTVEKPSQSAGDNWLRLIIWRVHGRTQVYDQLAPLEGLEGIWNMQWSPDGKRLLFCGSRAMGSLDMHSGSLYVLSVPPSQRYFVHNKTISPDKEERILHVGLLRKAARGIRSARWVGRRTIRYWTSGISVDGSKPKTETVTCR